MEIGFLHAKHFNFECLIVLYLMLFCNHTIVYRYLDVLLFLYSNIQFIMFYRESLPSKEKKQI